MDVRNVSEQKHWWQGYPWRMVQTNFREIDMSDVDAEKFASDLSDFGATVVTLNAGGILASYESKLPYHTVSKHLTGSSLKEIIDACHEKGIRVIARMDFSKIPFEVYTQHPDWAFRTADGSIVEQNGFVQTCQNSEYQQEKVLEILQELLLTHPFDGVYCNMSGFIATDYNGKIYGMCTCDRCRAGFKAAFNMDAPTKLDMKDPVTMRYMGFQSGSGKKLREKMNAAIKAINPEIAVDKVDYLRTESHTDIGEPIWVYSASSNSRQTTGGDRHLISDNASADFMGFRYRESSVSPGVMELRQWQNLANSGAVSLYIMGRLDNHRDKSSFAGSKKVFQFHKKHQELLNGLTSAAQVLLVTKAQQARSDAESYGWIRALTASHIPFDEVKSSGIRESLLSGKKVVILADAKDLQPQQCELLDRFAESGGIVIASGDSGVWGNAASLKCLGIDQIYGKKRGLMSTVFVATEPEFVRCATAPVIAPGEEITEAQYAETVKKYLHTQPEPMFGPPEVCYAKVKNDAPGLTMHPFGTGKGIFIPWNCGSFYHNEGYTNTLSFMQDVLFGFCQLPEIAPKLHPTVELVLSQKEGKKVVSLINTSGYFGNSFFDPIPMADIEITLPGDYVSAQTLNGGTVALKNNTIHLDVLKEFEMIVLEEK